MKLIPNSVTRTIARNILVAKKNSPHIFFAGGVVGVISGSVLACRATLKLEDNLDEFKHDVEVLKKMKSNVGIIRQDGRTYTEQDYFKDFGYVYSKGVLRLGKLYGPAILVGGTSIAALAGSHVQMTRRNHALTVTLAAVSKAFDEYRIRVQEEIGKERELQIHRGVEDKKIEVDGKKKSIQVKTNTGLSPYAVLFDEASYNFRKNAEYNRIFLQAQQNYANHRLQAFGHVFLNEVYDSIGLDHTQAGAVVGWIYEGEGDRYIDFGIYETFDNKDFDVNEPRIWLDFNVDGVIYDKI